MAMMMTMELHDDPGNDDDSSKCIGEIDHDRDDGNDEGLHDVKMTG